jgi:5-methyltetrahydropteroyltriglutamate--homocysteine methyltransferase
MVCTGPITYKGHDLVKRDIENFKAALGGVKPEEAFMPAISPSNVEEWQRNAYYKTGEEYIVAIGEAMREEYKAIVDAGLILQIDDPRLVSYYLVRPGASIAECRKWANQRVEALNHALRGLPEDRIRYHICWGSWHGPHTTDLPLRSIVDLLLQVRAGAYSIEAGNVRHEHEWKVWRDVKLPAGKILIPGVVSHATNVVEHPELVADRLIRFAEVVGRENVVAGTDCGLGGRIHHQLVWAKLEALVEGARMASRRLWR